MSVLLRVLMIFLNEVLSLNAQECLIACRGRAGLLSSMKS